MKDRSINYINQIITKEFGDDFFELPDFWDADNFAIAYKKGNRLVYISTWNNKNNFEKDLKFYCEFELINESSSEPLKSIKQFHDIDINELISNIRTYLEII